MLKIDICQSEAVAEVDLIIGEVSGLSAVEQITFAGPLEPKCYERALAIIEQRRMRVPLQYILGYTYFMGLKLAVEPGVFIPRADTECLVEFAIELLKKESKSRPYVMDIGTGSGAIAIALAKNLAGAKILGVDISERSCQVARKNAEHNGVDKQIELVNGNWREHVPLDLDMIVCNPPYIPQYLKDSLAKEVVDYEPHLALFGEDPDGLGYYRQLARSGKSAFNKLDAGWLLCELGDGQANDCIKIFEQESWAQILTRRDLGGIVRVLAAKS